MTTNKHHTVLYIGLTGSMVDRGRQHKERLKDGFTKRYNVDKLVYIEEYQYVCQAIAREKQLKGWTRKKKEALINKLNPQWRDLYEDYMH
ncbi:MAG TPA: GIY-YIG nuclease family protein [Balneolaceae bacterium]